MTVSAGWKDLEMILVRYPDDGYPTVRVKFVRYYLRTFKIFHDLISAKTSVSDETALCEEDRQHILLLAYPDHAKFMGPDGLSAWLVFNWIGPIWSRIFKIPHYSPILTARSL